MTYERFRILCQRLVHIHDVIAQHFPRVTLTRNGRLLVVNRDWLFQRLYLDVASSHLLPRRIEYLTDSRLLLLLKRPYRFVLGARTRSDNLSWLLDINIMLPSLLLLNRHPYSIS